MPRYVAYVDEKAVSAIREMAGKQARITRPSDMKCISRDTPDGPIELTIPPGMIALHYFDASSPAVADAYFKRLQRDGCPADIRAIGNADNSVSVDGPKVWHWRGDVPHLKRHQHRFGLPDHTAKSVQGDQHFKRVTRILSQHCDAYHKLPKSNGVANTPPYQLDGISESLKCAEHEVKIVALILVAMMEAMDDAYRAFGIDHGRGFRLAFVESPVGPEEPAPAPNQNSVTKRNHKAVAAGAN